MVRGRLEKGAIVGLTKDTTRLFHGPWHDHVSEYIGIGIYTYVRNHLPEQQFKKLLQNFERALNLTWKVKVNQHQKQYGP